MKITWESKSRGECLKNELSFERIHDFVISAQTREPVSFAEMSFHLQSRVLKKKENKGALALCPISRNSRQHVFRKCSLQTPIAAWISAGFTDHDHEIVVNNSTCLFARASDAPLIMINDGSRVVTV